MEVIARHYLTTIPFRANPEILMNNTPVSRCDIRLDDRARVELSSIVSNLEMQAPTKEPDLYWRIQFRDLSNSASHTLYMGRSYVNAPSVGIVVDGVSAEVDMTLVQWFESSVDIRNCSLRR